MKNTNDLFFAAGSHAIFGALAGVIGAMAGYGAMKFSRARQAQHLADFFVPFDRLKWREAGTGIEREFTENRPSANGIEIDCAEMDSPAKASGRIAPSPRNWWVAESARSLADSPDS